MTSPLRHGCGREGVEKVKIQWREKEKKKSETVLVEAVHFSKKLLIDFLKSTADELDNRRCCRVGEKRKKERNATLQ